MTLRCFLFSSDEGTAAILRQILSNLGIEGEFCTNAVIAAEKITNQPFQIVVIDWDQQPEAGLLLNTAQERKAAERPLTLAIVSNDADAPRALHAGANSLLRKPIVAHQAKDTLTTARHLLASKQGSAPAITPVIQVATQVPAFDVTADQNSTTLRAGDFLQTPTITPGENFETEASVPQLPDEFAVQAVRPVRDLEPMAAAVVELEDVADPASKPGGTRGLEWYLKHKVAVGTSPNSGAAAATAPIPSASNSAPEKPELLGYDQTRSDSTPVVPAENSKTENLSLKPPLKSESSAREQRKEAELFAYIQGEKHCSSDRTPSSSLQFAKRALVPALVLAAIAIVAAPQAPWHSWLQGSWRSANHALHVWLNPQPVTPTQGPMTHETFTRAGDEYKLPVAEQIPDATTDPSQIEVVPVTDPTVKKTNPEGGNVMDPSAIPINGSTPTTDTPPQNPATANLNTQVGSVTADPFRPPSQTPAQSTVSVVEAQVASHMDSPPATTSPIPASAKPVPALPTQPRVVTPAGVIPPSLRSQLAPANAAVVSNKPMDAAAPAIEPVEVVENAERALIADSPAPVYPNNAKGQQAMVVLQVFIARDGTVQDAKFMQGSLLFARNAIDAVKLWKFKPYLLNGRPVSVQTQLTLRFRPAQ